MKIKASPQTSNLDDSDEFRRYVSIFLQEATAVINGHISFADNMDGNSISVVFPSANSQVAIEHRLGRVPDGYVVTKKSAGVSVYDGSSNNTSSTIFLKSTGAATVTLFIF